MKSTFMQECYDKYVTEEIKARIMKREEEIKDAALRVLGDMFPDLNRAFLLGAEWADENPAFMNKATLIIDDVNMTPEQIRDAMNEPRPIISIDKSPWRDAKKELPKEKCKVYVLKNGVPDFAIYTGRKKNKTFVTAYLIKHLVGTYLDISENGIEFKKDVSALFRKDITNEVTHWMPIPELPKGE